jgi:50S ribosomal protein L16 3-hydroxylase
VRSPLGRAELFELAAQDDVESRLVQQAEPGSAAVGGPSWQLRQGPFPRRALPALKRLGWTLLVQGLDLHCDAARRMLDAFRFVPAARLDDLMLSYASEGGGVGPHLDSYDVFLLQVHGRRRWQVGRVPAPAFVPGVPLRILENFQPEQAWVLEPGDMLYLPPRWGHDGVALDECMTCSIGFRAPSQGALAAELLVRLADGAAHDEPRLYRDPRQAATSRPGRIPEAYQAFATQALTVSLSRRRAVAAALGEALTEPKAEVWFEAGCRPADGQGLVLDRRSRMLYDDDHVFINGECFRAGGRDARLLAGLADSGRLSGPQRQQLSAQAQVLVLEWAQSGWLRAEGLAQGSDR